MFENLRLAFRGIWTHKLRSFLTMLGIIIGIAAIIAIVSTIEGTNQQIKQNLIGSGSNTVDIQLYENDWPIDLSYSEAPYGVPQISDEILKEIKDLDEVKSASKYTSRQVYDGVYFINNSIIIQYYSETACCIIWLAACKLISLACCENNYCSFSFFSKYSGNSSNILYLEIPNFINDFFNVVSATNLSASLHRSNPIVSLSPSVFSNSSTALT